MMINYNTIEIDTKEKLKVNLMQKYWSNLDEMISQVDIISIHCPFTAETFHLLSKIELGY